MKEVREPRAGYGETRSTANITLALPTDLKEELVTLAHQRGCSVNALMVGVIENLVRGEKRATGADFVALARSLPPSQRSVPYKWNREDAYEGKRFGNSD